jgi:hypothetical protein
MRQIVSDLKPQEFTALAEFATHTNLKRKYTHFRIVFGGEP